MNSDLMAEKSGKGLLAAIILFAGAMGCSVALESPQLAAPADRADGSLGASRTAVGIDGKVGWGRFTAFYIPIVPVYVDGNANAEVMKLVREALSTAGYDVRIVDRGDGFDSPVVKCSVERFWFNNYTWAFPVVPTWGGIELNISLASRTGNVVWSKTFTGSGLSFNFFNGYSSAANKAMEDLLTELVAEVTKPEFRAVISRG